jgi:NADP-dependent 3-hydroxy acid dehydrogenase YdfG
LSLAASSGEDQPMNNARDLPSVFAPGNVALVTGAASGIGLAAARRFAGLGMKLVMVDLGGETLERVRGRSAGGE